MKKIFRVIFGIFVSFLILISALVFFAYSKGPYFALEKLKVIAREKFAVNIEFENAGAIGNSGFFIKNLTVKKDKISLSLKQLKVLYIIDWKNQKAEITLIRLEDPEINLQLLQSEESAEQTKQAMRPQTSLIENLLLAPPTQIKVNSIEVANLKANIKIEKHLLSNQIENTELKLAGLDLNLKIGLLPHIADFELKSVVKQKIYLRQKNGAAQWLIEVENAILNFDVNLAYQENKKWVYSLKSLKLEMRIPNFEKKDQISFNAKSTTCSLKLDLLMQSKNLFVFDDYYPERISWAFQGHTEKISGKISEAFHYLDTKQTQLRWATQGELKSSTRSAGTFEMPYEWNAGIDIEGGPFYFEGQRSDFELKTHWQNNIGKLNLQIKPGNLVNLTLESELLKSQTQVSGTLETQIPKKLAERVLHQNISGTLKSPFHLLIKPDVNEKNILSVDVDAIIGFKNVQYEKNDIHLYGINGQIPILEKIILNMNKQTKERFRFKTLYSENPFARVDYERIDAYVRNTEPIKIEKIRWSDKSFGPFKGIISLEQNLISVRTFLLDLVNGSASGEFFLDLYPGNQRMGFLGRLTQIDLSQILPNKFLTGTKINSQLPFSARTGVLLMISRKSLNGRMDINQVDGQQLTAFINFLDPNCEDEKMNKIRSWLAIGYPTAVQLDFHEGTLDMNLDFALMGLNKHQSIYGISFQSFIDKALEMKKEEL